ncbi:sulfatase-like hydrolase/transferase [Burkholderia sp. LMU1-1-1.1]|uniref:sulfatase-like hydrolase/transferase n=1 Tax=Burkholderia sp. LMU1-1-1.1 TaxID=3135266 RepID=UPI0034413E54
MGNKITRRQAITRTSIALGGVLLNSLGHALAAPVGAKQTTRPNILLLIAGGWSWQGSEAVDRLGLRMPTFTRLRREGVSFENAFVASPGAKLPYTDLLEKNGYVVANDDFDALLAKRPAGKPLLFCLESKNSHRQSKAPVDTASIIVPPYLPDTPAVRGDIAAYRSEIERFDHEASLLIDRLERAGRLSDTLVVMTGKGGWPFPRSEGTLYDAGTHVPLVVMYPGGVAGGNVSKALVSSDDLAATLLDIAGATKRATSNGRTVVLTGSESYPARAVRTTEYLYIRNVFPDRWPAGAPARQAITPAQLGIDINAAFACIAPSPTKTAMIVGRGDPAMDRLLDLATAKRPATELYDVRADPYQLNNLASDPAMKTIVARLDQQLTSHHGDT